MNYRRSILRPITKTKWILTRRMQTRWCWRVRKNKSFLSPRTGMTQYDTDSNGTVLFPLQSTLKKYDKMNLTKSNVKIQQTNDLNLIRTWRLCMNLLRILNLGRYDVLNKKIKAVCTFNLTLRANPTKWSNTSKTIRRLLPTNYLSVWLFCGVCT